MAIPRDRKITLYQQDRPTGKYWYLVWSEGKAQRHRYIGQTLPDTLQQAYNQAKQAQEDLQAVIRVVFHEPAERKQA